MISNLIKYAVWVGMLAGALTVSRFVPSLGAQQSAATATDALQKAHVLDRLAEAMPAEHKGTAPGFVLDRTLARRIAHISLSIVGRSAAIPNFAKIAAWLKRMRKLRLPGFLHHVPP